jgi:hypothetical protein
MRISPCNGSINKHDLQLSLRKNLRDFFDRVPIARGGRQTQELLDLAEVADRFHLPTIETQDESVLDRNDLYQPVIIRGQAERKMEAGREVVWLTRSRTGQCSGSRVVVRMDSLMQAS